MVRESSAADRDLAGTGRSLLFIGAAAGAPGWHLSSGALPGEQIDDRVLEEPLFNWCRQAGVGGIASRVQGSAFVPACRHMDDGQPRSPRPAAKDPADLRPVEIGQVDVDERRRDVLGELQRHDPAASLNRLEAGGAQRERQLAPRLDVVVSDQDGVVGRGDLVSFCLHERGRIVTGRPLACRTAST